MRWLWTLLIVGVGCSDGIQAGRTLTDPEDADGDGFSVEEDCDDADAAINPAALEVCNGVDDNCDGRTDADDATLTDGVTGYADRDGDGFGDPEAVTVSCALGDGVVADNTDCDDGQPSTHPGAPEQCSTGADDDCDGDLNDSGADGCIEVFEDLDGDGFGGAGSDCRCTVDEDYPAFFSQDCDDSDPAVNPDASEVCGNGIDDDCDGTPGTCPLAGTLNLAMDAQVSITGFREDMSAGALLAAPGDLDGDGRADLVVGATGASGAVGVFRGGWTGSVTLNEGDGYVEGVAGVEYLSAVGDVDGDGSPDLAMGSSTADGGAGAVWIWTDPLSTGDSLDATSVLLTGWSGAAVGPVAGVGDLNGDGASDLVVAAVGDGEVYPILGPVVGSSDVSALGSPVRGAGSGSVVLNGISDFNGDGLQDFGVGAPSRSSSGRLWLMFGPATAVTSLSDADLTVTGGASGDQLGAAVSSAGDIDGDGYADVLVGAPGEDLDGRDIGRVYLLRGPVTGQGAAEDLAHVIMRGEFTGDGAGGAVDGGGDIDGDGTLDLVVGASGHNQAGTDAGLTYVMYGPVSGSIELKFSNVSIEGRARRDASGSSALILGDINGDGFDDVFVGSPDADVMGANAGAADVLLGRGL